MKYAALAALALLIVAAAVVACGAPARPQPPAPPPAAEAAEAAEAEVAPPAHGHEHGHPHGSSDALPAGADEHRPHAMNHRFEDAEAWAKVFDDPARDAWQQPERVIAALALTPKMVVADVGAGTGYFTMRLARAVPQGHVIATDIEPDMIRYLTERAARERLGNVRAVLSTEDDPALAPASVDRILVVDVWHHLADRAAYARKLAAALRPGGQLVVVDFTLAASHGPPKQHRLPPEAILADLRAAGLDAKASATTLPEQYIVIGARR